MLTLADQTSRALVFRAAHAHTFVIPNPWDAGSARLLEHTGFLALATTSAGFAFSKARPDNGVSREQVMRHLEEIAAATSLPVSADLENGFGGEPATVAETLTLAAQAGAVGGSIEDSRSDASGRQFELELAIDRIVAAVDAVRALPFPFMLTARAENFVAGNPDLNDTITRLQRYQEAGADVLFAPGLVRAEDIALVVREVDRPVNVLLHAGMNLSVSELAALGVRRISTGGSLARAAYGEFLRAARELQGPGTATYVARAAPSGELGQVFQGSRHGDGQVSSV